MNIQNLLVVLDILQCVINQFISTEINRAQPEISPQVLVDIFFHQMADKDKEEQNVEMWKIKKLIKSLSEARGNGTSMISLILPVKLSN